MRIAVVVQRYGREITGGSEALCRAVVLRLSRRHAITVYTTTALDYVTWRGHYREGEDRDNGIVIRRFAPERERDLESFNRYSDWIYANRHSQEDERKWLQDQGPYCPRLAEALHDEQERYDVFLFYTYLYYPTVAGMQAVDKPAVLVPTAHREPAAALDLYKDLYRRADGLVFNTHAERQLVEQTFRPRARRREVAGMGITPPPSGTPHARHDRPNILYAGRIDAGKGCAELLEYFIRFRIQRQACSLYLMGSLNMSLPKHPDVHYLGFVPEQEKYGAYKAANVTVVPSRLESLSIVALESLVVGTPILVNAGSDVLREHCVRGNAGLFYGDFEEFEEALSLLLTRPELASTLGAQGRDYVFHNYTWERVLARYESVLQGAMRR